MKSNRRQSSFCKKTHTGGVPIQRAFKASYQTAESKQVVQKVRNADPTQSTKQEGETDQASRVKQCGGKVQISAEGGGLRYLCPIIRVTPEIVFQSLWGRGVESGLSVLPKAVCVWKYMYIYIYIS